MNGTFIDRAENLLIDFYFYLTVTYFNGIYYLYSDVLLGFDYPLSSLYV